MTNNCKFVRRNTYRITSDAPCGGLEPSVLVERFSDAMTAAVMESIDRATIDQGQNVILDERSLRQAIRAGIAGYLLVEIGKRRSAGKSNDLHIHAARPRQTDV
jgi:hypothetical protein